jgi:uncharacterized membrane protein YcaP (DUF421 family)
MKDGKWQSEGMDKTLVQEVDVMASARLRGIRNLADIKYAVRERSGSISIIKRKK